MLIFGHQFRYLAKVAQVRPKNAFLNHSHSPISPMQWCDIGQLIVGFFSASQLLANKKASIIACMRRLALLTCIASGLELMQIWSIFTKAQRSILLDHVLFVIMSFSRDERFFCPFILFCKHPVTPSHNFMNMCGGNIVVKQNIRLPWIMTPNSLSLSCGLY